MKTAFFSLLLLCVLPFLAAAQTEDKPLKEEVRDVKREIQKVFKEIEDERILEKMDSILEARWPQIEAELEDAWQKAEPRIEEAGEQIEAIIDEIWREVTGKSGGEMPQKEKKPKRKEL